MEKSNIKSILAVDFGSTTTKARLFNYLGNWSLYGIGESPTTVERPHLDVSIGLFNALNQIEVKKGIKLFDGEKINTEKFYATSSAGGGLQVVILAPTKEISGLRAEKAAMLAGAIVLKTFTLDSFSDETQIIREIAELKPDIIIISGGFDDSSSGYVEKLAEYVAAASPKPRFGYQEKIPVILAGSQKSNEVAQKILQNHFKTHVLDNVSPSENTTNIKPLIQAIHDIFIDHVMSNAPGYDKILKMTSEPPLATPIAAGKMIKYCAEKLKTAILGVDIGGATTDIFSCDQKGGNFLRTVSANYGMSFSATNVISDARKYLGISFSQSTRSALFDKMLRPNSLPVTLDALKNELVLAKSALRLAIKQHYAFRGEPLNPRLIIGSGGVISHAPFNSLGAEILIFGFEPTGIVEIVSDNLFLLPHLGAISLNYPEVAMTLFLTECIKPLCIYIRPYYFFSVSSNSKRVLAEVSINSKYHFELTANKRVFYSLPESIKEISIKRKWGVFFNELNAITFFPNSKTICLDGTKHLEIQDTVN